MGEPVNGGHSHPGRLTEGRELGLPARPLSANWAGKALIVHASSITARSLEAMYFGLTQYAREALSSPIEVVKALAKEVSRDRVGGLSAEIAFFALLSFFRR